ncbi:hypothetical protein BGZ65_007366 [Modicella reniformis]|uniref:Uncharacterized protein n=1 Tax=Modicella reniformis TaxID=1440133 RepID=A0A9P6M7P6_9FUNG|nr:hypothetical protein BGZ65_007366 [Modicella reniformis]
MDQSPVYYETTVVAHGYMDDEVLVDGLHVGGFVGFIWNMISSFPLSWMHSSCNSNNINKIWSSPETDMSFQFVGFFLTYLLHTSHATKNGSKAGLGITLLSMGMQMMTGKTELQEPDEDSDTGYMGNGGESMRSVKEYLWLSYFLVFLGAGIMLQAGLEFARAKKTEMVINTSSSTRAGEITTTVTETDDSIV